MVARALWVAGVLCLTCELALAGEAGGAPGRVDAVTLHRGQAAVSRVVAVPAGVGPVVVVVTDLPERMVPESLYADDVEGLQIRAVRYRERAVAEEPREEVRKLDTAIEAAEKSLRELERNQEAVRRKLAFLDKLGSFSATTTGEDVKKGALQTGELTKLASFVFEQQDALGKQLLELDERARQAKTEADMLRRRRTSLTPNGGRTAREAVVFLEKQKPAQAEIRLGYLVQGTDWTPAYNLRARERGAEVEIEYNASIQQLSGEDWRGVTLTLSTATPTLASDPPGLAPFRVTLEPGADARAPLDALRAERERRAAEEGFRSAATEENRQQAEAAANVAAARLNVLYFRGSPKAEELAPTEPKERGTAAIAVTYPLPGRHSIESRGDLQTARVATLKLQGDFSRIAEPTLTRYVYRQALVANKSETVLLPGKANAYLDGKFAGTGALPLVRPGQRFTAGFGVDTRLTTRHRLLQRQESILAGNKSLVLTYEILLENYSAQPIAVRVLDRIPMPADGKIISSLTETPRPLSTDPLYERLEKPNNILRWDVDLPPEASDEKAVSIRYTFKVEFDKNLQIDAGRTIAPLFALARPLEPWKVEDAWSKDETRLAVEAGKQGEADRITLEVSRGKDGKNAIGRRVEADLSGYRWLLLDLESRIAAGARVAVGLSAGKDWKYFESMPTYVGAGEHPNVVFDLTAPIYKTEATSWQYSVRPESLHDVRAIYLVFYPAAGGTLIVRDAKLAK